MTAQDASFVSPGEGKKCNVFADTITIKVPSEMTRGAYSISEDVTPAGQRAPPHIHRSELETFIVLEGEHEFQCGELKFKATKAAIVGLPRRATHAFQNPGNTIGETLGALVPGG